jgi:hypothetical protein
LQGGVEEMNEQTFEERVINVIETLQKENIGLKAHVERQNWALNEALDVIWPVVAKYQDTLNEAEKFILKRCQAINKESSKTPTQSLAAHNAEILEQAARVVLLPVTNETCTEIEMNILKDRAEELYKKAKGLRKSVSNV